jgi:hypothetical protein
LQTSSALRSVCKGSWAKIIARSSGVLKTSWAADCARFSTFVVVGGGGGDKLIEAIRDWRLDLTALVYFVLVDLEATTPGFPASFFKAPLRGRAMSKWRVVNKCRRRHHSRLPVVKIKQT